MIFNLPDPDTLYAALLARNELSVVKTSCVSLQPAFFVV